MMKRIAINVVCPLISMLLMTSCFGDEAEVAKSSEVALLSFSIKDLRTTYTTQKANGEDSTYTVVMTGATVKFTIDQDRCLVYNSDSIPYNTNVSRVLVNVKANGGVCYFDANGVAASIEDSIDFTNPVKFQVTSHDEQFTRGYIVSLNVHQVDPAKTSWQQLNAEGFPEDLFVEQKAFVKGDSLFVLGVDVNGACHVASASQANAAVWASAPCTGLEGNAAGLSVQLLDEVFYLTTDAGMYCSSDAVSWTAVASDADVLTLLAVEDTSVWGLSADGLVSSTDMVSWEVKQPMDKQIGRGVASFSEPLRTNEHIMRTIFVATPEAADTCALVWTKLTTDTTWVEVEPVGTNIYGCPHLENLVVLQYAGTMHAFGGKSVGNRKNPLEAFENCYESRDNGVTWKVYDGAFSLPEAFKGRTEAFSAATDGEYVWVMWSNGEVWSGRWNGLSN